MHGNPKPELIGKTGSHGCFRLTNWDALRYGSFVRGWDDREDDQPSVRTAFAMRLLLLSITAACFFACTNPAPVSATITTDPAAQVAAHVPIAHNNALLKATFEGAKVTLQEVGDGHRFHADIDLSLVLPNGGILRCDVIHNAMVDRQRYVVLDVEALSRPGNPMAHCGAGTEFALVWLHFNENWAAQGVQMILYGSCWHDLCGRMSADEKTIRIAVPLSSIPGKPIVDRAFRRERPEAGFLPE